MTSGFCSEAFGGSPQLSDYSLNCFALETLCDLTAACLFSPTPISPWNESWSQTAVSPHAVPSAWNTSLSLFCLDQGCLIGLSEMMEKFCITLSVVVASSHMCLLSPGNVASGSESIALCGRWPATLLGSTDPDSCYSL